MMPVCPVILCGGSGTRLWPLSRVGFPKQFISLSGDKSLFQEAVLRLNSLASNELNIKNSYIVTGVEHRFLALEQYRELDIGDGSFILEPCARNTAAALTLAALQIQEDFGESDSAVMIASPSDHHVSNQQSYIDALRHAVPQAAAGKVVMLGIQPDRPETGFGYIQHQSYSSHDQLLNETWRPVLRFVEKPSYETAKQYMDSGDYFWNSGLFVIKASVWLQALSEFRPDILLACQKAWSHSQVNLLESKKDAKLQFISPDANLFSLVPAESVDYAVMEKCPNSSYSMVMVPLNAGWSDLGAWDAVAEIKISDALGNVCHGDVILEQSKNTYVHASHRLVATVGVENLVVVETSDAVLVVDKQHSQEVKKIVAQLDRTERYEKNLHRKVNYLWGWYDTLDETPLFTVSRMLVKAGNKLNIEASNEYEIQWTVVSGAAHVFFEGHVQVIGVRDIFKIPQGGNATLENNEECDLEIIEIRTKY